MSLFHQRARLAKTGMAEPQLSEKAKEATDRLWRRYYAGPRDRHSEEKRGLDKPRKGSSGAGEAVSKTAKRKERQARADKRKRRRRSSSPVVDRTEEPGPKKPPPGPGLSGPGGGVDKAALLTGLFQEALKTLQTF